MPALTTVHMGNKAFNFQLTQYKPSVLIMRSEYDAMRLSTDLPRLTTLTADASAYSVFSFPHYVILKRRDSCPVSSLDMPSLTTVHLPNAFNYRKHVQIHGSVSSVHSSRLEIGALAHCFDFLVFYNHTGETYERRANAMMPVVFPIIRMLIVTLWDCDAICNLQVVLILIMLNHATLTIVH